MPKTQSCALVAILFSSMAAFAGQSLVIPSNPVTRGVKQLPDSRAYSTIGNWRVEGQVDNLSSDPAKWTGLFIVAGVVDLRFNSNSLVVAAGAPSLPLGSASAFRWVVQRNVGERKYTIELWNEQTGEYQFAEASGIDATPLDARGARMAIGSLDEAATPGLHIGFLRWYSTLRGVGGAPPPRVTADIADLLDYEFEGNLRDSSPNHANFSFNSGSPYFATTAEFPPAVNLAGTPLTVRAGFPAKLDASGSFSNSDSPALMYTWIQMPGLALGAWSGQTTATPTFTPPAFGTYYLELAVTDSTGRAGTKQFKLGAVATDDNGVVIFKDPNIGKILGPMVRFGANPWRWFDDRNKWFADAVGKSLDLYWSPFWNDALPGTIDVENGSPKVTGHGTSFLSTFCQGNSQPKENAVLFVWYPSDDYPGETGRAGSGVASCEDDTHLTLQFPYSVTESQQSLKYSGVVDNASSLKYYYWVNMSLPANYYDNVMAFYALYYRTGIDTYRDYARILADRWWTMPRIDRGRPYRLGSETAQGFGEARSWSLTGLVLRALDGRPEMWTGLNQFFSTLLYRYRDNGVSDLREHGLSSGFIGLCGLLHPDQAMRDSCVAFLAGDAAALYSSQQPAGNWTWFMPFYGTYGVAGPGSRSLVNVTNGSPQVTLASGTSDFRLVRSAGDGIIWFTSENPASNADGDPSAYRYTAGPDDSAITLDRPYEGTTGVKAWACCGMAGFGTQPFMAGIAGASFDYARLALEQAGDTEAAGRYRQFSADLARWIWNSRREETGGLWYGRGFVNCEPAGSDVPPGSREVCSAGDDVVNSRVMLGEVQHGFTIGYLASLDPAIRAAGDSFYTALWAKPGWSSPQPGDGVYLNTMDNNAYMGLMQPNGQLRDFGQNKWFGFFFGKGGGYSWPAARLGPPPAPNPQTMPVNIDLQAVPPGGNARVTVLEPTGATSHTLCSVSPCNVQIDARHASHLVSVDYVSSSGQVLAAGTMRRITRRP